MDEREREGIRMIVKEVIDELIRDGMLREASSMAYTEISAKIKAYYSRGQKDEEMKKAISAVEEDKYFKIIPLYFYYGYTIEEIAETFEVETSTIVRNKKRLCLEIYGKL